MGSLGSVSIGAIGRVALRYRPVAATIAAIIVIAFAVPGRPSSPPAPGLASGSGGEVAAVTGSSPAPPPPSAEASVVVPSPSLPAPTIAARPLSPVASTSVGSLTPVPGPTAAVPPWRPYGDEPWAPLTIQAAGWASEASGSPVATIGVPDGTLPVGTRLGQVDKASFVRLDGTDTSLVLVEEPGGRRAAVGAPSVKACAIDVADSGWVASEAMSFDEAPSWDPNACVEGVVADDGTWTFDLTSFPSRTAAAGFALVPTRDAPLDFQVTFER